MSPGQRSVLVTAGGSGIGAFIAAAFHQGGARVHVADIDGSILDRMKSEHPEYLATQADVSEHAEVEQVFQAHFGQYGGIDVLVNCAGIAGPTGVLENVRPEDWRRCLAVNLDATFLCARKAIPSMKSRGSGRIINIASTAGWHGYPMRSPYAAAKWAVIGLTKSLAMELGQYGISVNAICPGSVEGARMDRVIAAEAREKGISEQAVRTIYTRGCSMRTFISGQDIADMAIFLASDQASRVSGQIMNVDGHLENIPTMDDLEAPP